MKKRTRLFYALTALLLSCGHHEGNTNIHYTEKDGVYSMKAVFNENRTKAVDHYMNEALGSKNNMSFMNMETNAELKLTDGTHFHLKKFPGHVEIDFDKSTNSSAAFNTVKQMCEGLKAVILD